MEHKNLAAALAAAQSEMGHAALDSENPYFKSKYSSLTAVIDAVKPLAKHGIAYIQHSRPVNNGVGIETVFLRLQRSHRHRHCCGSRCKARRAFHWRCDHLRKTLQPRHGVRDFCGRGR